MKIQKTAILLLALLLAAMAMVSIVSAVDENNSKEFDNLIDANYVPIDIARNHASFALLEFASLGALGEKEKWINAEVNPKPIEIYDINGKKLFYLFSIEKKNQKIGEIKIAASKLLGGSVITIGEQDKSIDLTTLEKKVLSEISLRSTQDSPSSAQIVCYQYPKIGMIAHYIDPMTKETRKIILDANDFSVIPDRSPRFEGDIGLISYYATLPHEKYSTLINSWNQYDLQVQKVTDSDSTLRSVKNGTLSVQMMSAYNKLAITPKAVSEYKTISVPLYGQIDSTWCAVATAQMISAWHGVSRTQNQIANKMGVSPGTGATINQELNYYRASIASGGLGKPGSLDYYSINWYDSKNEINNNRPFKIGNLGHARCMRGYLRAPSNGYTYFYFNDPWPVNQGNVYWEWFNELNPNFYNNHIKVKN
jgi:hypothetical protein